MKYNVEITPSAEADVEEAYCYIRNDSPENAVKWRHGFYGAADSLSRFPEACGRALENDLVEFEVRQKLYGYYRILFTLDDDRVIVLNVCRGARCPMRADELTRPDSTP